MIAGLETITGGDIDIGNKRVNDLDPSDRGIAMVFQSYALYPHMTVRENMGFALRFAGVPKAEIEKQVGEAARILELEPLLNRRPKELRGGQRVPLAAKAPNGAEVTVGIRPEHFKGRGSAQLDLNIEMIEHLGAETYA